MSDIDPSTPIEYAWRSCTSAERAAIKDCTPPYDGVRTWGDLLTVRAPKDESDEIDARSAR